MKMIPAALVCAAFSMSLSSIVLAGQKADDMQGEFALPIKFSEIKRLNRILDLPA
jgi:hypothetical protein